MTLKLSLLALDYDGTIARDGRLDRGVREALGEARARGVLVVLVTGRILADLQRLLDTTLVFDAIVAENGALLHLPASGRTTRLAPPPPQAFLDELGRRGVPFLVGDTVVEALASYAASALQALRELELPLALLFNRDRMMVLPQSISKATGLREACRTLRASLHGALAIGDAENDHELLTACEVGVAVGWGSAALQRVADEVLPGSGPEAVGPYLRTLVERRVLPQPRVIRRRIHLGIRRGGEVLSLAMRGRNILIAGSPRTGKSWLAGLLAEQLVLMRYCVCVIDPEGDYTTLEALPGVMVLRSDGSPPPVDEVVRALRYADVSVVVDLSTLTSEAKCQYVPALLAALLAVRSASGLPHRIVLDEAHQFLRRGACAALGGLAQGGSTFVTFRASEVDATVVASAEAVLVSGELDMNEAAALHRLCGARTPVGEWSATLASLGIDEAALLPGAEESGGDLVRFHVAQRITAHVRHRRKYLAAEVAAQHAFVFVDRERALEVRARSLNDVLAALEQVGDTTLAGHLARNDLSRWIADVLTDPTLAAAVQLLERAAHVDGMARARGPRADDPCPLCQWGGARADGLIDYGSDPALFTQDSRPESIRRRRRQGWNQRGATRSGFGLRARPALSLGADDRGLDQAVLT